jgi:cell division protein ZapA (FtsZ GTPase activity inhibitor)
MEVFVMASILLTDELAKRLQEVAQRENQSVEELVTSLLDERDPVSKPERKAPNWDLILGAFDDDVTDMSTTVQETLQKYFQEKYGDAD